MSIYIFIIACYVGSFVLSKDNAIFFINDDVLLDHILSGKYTQIPSPYITYMTNILGNFIFDLNTKFGATYSWYGIILSILNFNILLSMLLIIYLKNNFLFKISGIIVIIFITPSLILSPTFTITSILLSGAGLIGLVLNLTLKNTNYFTYLYFLFNLILGYLVRIDAFFGVITFLFIPSLLVLIVNRKSLQNKKKVAQLLISIFVFLGVFLYQKSVIQTLIKSEVTFQEYVDIQKIPLIMTPASLKLHQNIISGKSMNGIWSNVDYIVYRNWMYGDSEVFGSKNFKIGNASVSKYFGWQGIRNADIKETISTIKYYLQDFKYLLAFLSLMSIILLTAHRGNLKIQLLIVSLISNYLTVFYFLAATLRIPTRIGFPFLILLWIFLALFIPESSIRKNIKSKILILSLSLSVLFTVLSFQFKNELGLKSLLESNQQKLIFSKNRNMELSKFSKEAVFIGPIQYFPIVNQGTLSRNLYWSAGINILPLSWATYSPYWITLASRLKIDSSNIYNSLAKQENVYWVSNSYLAEILEMYMNDRQIFRGKLCSVAKLSGSDQAEIFTYQAKESDC